jgi:hypothetical protein
MPEILPCSYRYLPAVSNATALQVGLEAQIANANPAQAIDDARFRFGYWNLNLVNLGPWDSGFRTPASAVIDRNYSRKISPSHVIGFARSSCITSMKYEFS